MDQPNTREELLEALRERTPGSGKVWQDAQRVVPGGLLSGARYFKPYPFFTERGEGPYIWDMDENRYLDCCMAYGVLFLGHRPSAVVEALNDQLERGTVYGTPHGLEVAFAEKLIECIPCADQILLCNSGTEATMQAIRLMRAYTGRDKIAKFEGGYHGWHDYGAWSIDVVPDEMGPADRPNAVPNSAGIPEPIEDTLLMLPCEESAFDLIEEHAAELAGVMIEPVFGGGTIPMSKEFLEKLRDVTRRTGVFLMFDEVITGFRMALGGAQEVHGIMPDLATYGKIIGGGLPVGAVGFAKEFESTVTDNDFSVFVGGTFSGNPFTLAAGNALLGHLMDNPQIYDELNAKGDFLRSGFNEFAQAKGLPATMTGIASLFQTHIKHPPVEKPRDLIGQHEDALNDLQLFLRLNGVFIPFLHLAFLSAAHSQQDVEEVLRIHQVSVEACLAMHQVT